MQNFITYLQAKNYSNTTQKAYIRYVNDFFKWTSKDATQIEKKDILSYLEYLQTTKKQANITRRNSLIALHHYFTFLAQNQTITTAPTTFIKIRGTHKKTLYNIYTSEELTQLYDDFYHTFSRNFNDSHIPKNQQQQSFLSRQRNYVMLGLLLYQGLHTNELQKITLDAIDLNKATIKIPSTRKSNAKTLPLNAPQIGTLINYINVIRPQFLAFCSETEQLFFTLPESSKRKTSTQNLIHTFKPLTKQVKSINKNFLNFKQIRASVITHWIKTVGLRKAQYLAGHRHISSTEQYLSNDIESLSDDMNKYNPF
jgi:site-specific recombinase XerD